MNTGYFQPSPHETPRRRCAFTLLEMTVVVAIVAILSVSAIPALSLVRGARQAAGAQHVERLLLTARAQSMASGRPWGVEVDYPHQRVRLVYIPTVGAAPVAAPASGLASAEWTTLTTAYPGAAITNITYADGSSNASGTVWFDTNADPAVRNSSGARTGSAVCDAAVVFDGGTTVHVRRLTGAVERP